MSSEMYFIKGNKKKYIISELRSALVYLREKDIKSAQKIIKNVKEINDLEGISLGLEISGVEVRLLDSLNEASKGRELLYQLINNYRKDKEKRLYYIALLADKFNNNNLKDSLFNEISDGVHSLHESYIDGELNNTEGIIYINLVLSKIYTSLKKYKYALATIKKAENYIKDIEMYGQYPKVYNSYIDIYKKLQNKKMTDYYERAKNTFLKSKIDQ